MFIRRVARTNGHTATRYTTLHLVESFRTERGPRQRTILDLGPLDIPREDYKALANAIEAALLGQASLFPAQDAYQDIVADAARRITDKRLKKQGLTQDDPAQDQDQIEEPVYEPTDLSSIKCQEVRSIGPEWVAHAMFERLQLMDILRGQGLNERVCRQIEALVVGRAVAPGSERATWQWLTQQTGLVELMGDDVSMGSLSGFYRAGDQLWDIHEEVERKLQGRERELFDLNESIYLLDLTNIYLEGDAEGNAKAQHGHSKEKRSDCKLLSLALVVDQHGFAKCSRMYPGNIHEATTVIDILADMKQQLGREISDMTVVMDRGLATEDTIQLLREHGAHYIVATRGREAWDPSLSSVTLNEDKGDDNIVTVQRDPTRKSDDDIYIRCHSKAREAKECAMRTKQEQRLLKELTTIQAGLSKPRYSKNYAKICERIGRLRNRFPQAAPYYTITVVPEKGDQPNTLQQKTKAIDLTWEKNDKHNQRISGEGSYLLRTNRHDLDDATIWSTYITLTRVERSFRTLKSDLGLRPCYHQTETRSDTHLLIAILAYHLIQAVEYTLQQHNDHRSWSSIRQILSTHQRLTITCSTRAPDGQRRQTSLRLCSEPEPAVADLYRKLDLNPTPLPRKRADY